MPEPDQVPVSDLVSEDDWQRRRRLAEVFGDVLPATTSDERDDDRGRDRQASEEWLKQQVPPHHG